MISFIELLSWMNGFGDAGKLSVIAKSPLIARLAAPHSINNNNLYYIVTWHQRTVDRQLAYELCVFPWQPTANRSRRTVQEPQRKLYSFIIYVYVRVCVCNVHRGTVPSSSDVTRECKLCTGNFVECTVTETCPPDASIDTKTHASGTTSVSRGQPQRQPCIIPCSENQPLSFSLR